MKKKRKTFGPGDFLKIKMKEAKITKNQLGSRLSIPDETINMLIDENISLTKTDMDRIKNLLGVDKDEWKKKVVRTNGAKVTLKNYVKRKEGKFDLVNTSNNDKIIPMDNDRHLKNFVMYLLSRGESHKMICELTGLTNSEVNFLVEIIKADPENRKRLQNNIEYQNVNVEKSLYDMCMGFEKDVESVTSDGDIITFKRFFPPNFQAISFWLKNNASHKYQDNKYIHIKEEIDNLTYDELKEEAKKFGIDIDDGTIEAEYKQL